MDDVTVLKNQVAQLSRQVQMLEDQLGRILQSIGPSQLYNPLTTTQYAQVGTGNIIMGGASGGVQNLQVWSDSTNPGPGGANALVAEIGNFLDPAGTLVEYHGIWAVGFWVGGTGPSNASLFVDSTGNLTINQNFSGTRVQIDGVRPIGGGSTAPGIGVTNVSTTATVSITPSFIVALNASGHHIWSCSNPGTSGSLIAYDGTETGGINSLGDTCILQGSTGQLRLYNKTAPHEIDYQAVLGTPATTIGATGITGYIVCVIDGVNRYIPFAT